MNIINDVLVDKLFKDPPKRTKEIPLLSEKTASGDGMVIINDAYSDFPITNLTLRGKSEQVTTTGKNLFDIENASASENYVHTEQLANIDISSAIVFNVKKNTDYCLSVAGKAKKPTVNFNIANDNQRKSIMNELKMTETVNSLDSGKIYIGFSGGELSANIQNLPKEYFNIQLEEGKLNSKYEPYTGCQPSPSPDYPQEIKSVGKWNEEKQKYEVDVKVTGRNLFNGKLSKGKFITDDMNVVSDLVTMNTFDKPVEIEPNTDYVISANGVIWQGNINVYDENGKKIVQHFAGKFKTPSNAKYIRASIANVTAPIDSKIQMEYGTAMNEFEQYHQPQTLTITSDRPITKWDKLVEQDGQIGWLYQSAIDEYSGETNVSPYKTGFGFYFLLENKNIESGEGYCEELQQCTSEKVPCIHFNLAKNTYVYTLNTETIYGSTVSDIKNYLKTHPLHIVYKTETTEFIPLPKEEQDAIRALKTYYPTTVITTNGGELPVGIEVTYMHPEYIPTKQSALRMWFKENPII